MFEDDYLRATLPGADAPVTTDPVALGALLERLEAGPRGAPLHVVFGDAGMALHTVQFARSAGAYVDSEGAAVVAWREPVRVEQRLFRLHHSLFAGEAGERISGWAALLAVALAASGAVLWWPARRAFRPRAWPVSRRRRDVLAQHRDLGAIFALPLVVLALTGAALHFPAEAQRLLAVVMPEPPAPSAAELAPAPAAMARPGDVDWPAALMHAQARFPDAQLRIVTWPARPGEPATVRLRRVGEWHANGRTLVRLDPATGRVLATVDALALPRAERFFHTLWPVHAAKLGGRAVDLLTCASGLALALLGSLASWAFVGRRLPSRLRQVPFGADPPAGRTLGP